MVVQKRVNGQNEGAKNLEMTGSLGVHSELPASSPIVPGTVAIYITTWKNAKATMKNFPPYQIVKMNRWNVTYTKHIKQKRKIYQDGILKLSADKVALYDDCEKLIVSRFLKKDEVIESGGMLAFETHLVDIGDPEVSHIPSADLNVPGEDVILKERAGAEGEKPVYLGKKKSTLHSLPLKNHANAVHGSIRDNKKTTTQTEAVQKHSDAVPINNREWNVLYATQITQKSKRYHDGILRLVRCGSHTNQVILLNEDGTVLGRKYLKSVECVETGRDYEFSNFLVQICEPRTLPVDNSHGGSLPQIAGCRSTGMDKLISNQKVTSIKSTPNDIQNEHTGVVDCGDLDGRFTNINSESKHGEWNALYTTQKTQKAKKYHDGILQLVNCGSHMKQVILLNEGGVVLSSKYLKSIECLKIGQMCEFPNYLVEICVQRTPAGGDTPKQPLEEVPESRCTGTCNFMNTRNDYSDKSLLKDIRKGHLEEATGGVNCDNGGSPSLHNRPRRDASQILSSLRRPVHTPQPSEIIVLDVERNNKMQEVDVRKPTEDNHTGISIVVDSGCQGNPPSHECSISSNRLSGEVTPDISPTKLDIDYAGMKNECPSSSIRGLEVSENHAYTSSKIVQTNSSESIFPCDSRPVDSTSRDKIASSSNSLPEDHNNANKNRSLTDEIMALQQDWSALSYQVSAIGNMKSPSFVQNNKHADERCETVHHSGASSPICVATDPRSENSDLQGISNTCLNADGFPTFDLGFE